MNADFIETHLVAYVSLREALGFQMRAEKVLLPEFVAFVKAHGSTEPIRTEIALEWACRRPRTGGQAVLRGASVSHGGFSSISRPPHQTPRCQPRDCCQPLDGRNRISSRPRS